MFRIGGRGRWPAFALATEPGSAGSMGANEIDSAGTVRFRFEFESRYQRAARAFGITPERAWVDVGPDELVARFGRWRVRTPLANIERVELTGPYAFAKTAGPARLGVTDLGLTFATNHRRGVLMTFRRRVRGIEPLGLLTHGELTVTVADPERFAELVGRRAAIIAAEATVVELTQ